MSTPGPLLDSDDGGDPADRSRQAEPATRGVGIAAALLVLLTVAMLMLVPLFSATRSLAQRRELDRLVQAAGVPALIERAAAERAAEGAAEGGTGSPERWTETAHRARAIAARLAGVAAAPDAATADTPDAATADAPDADPIAFDPVTDVPGGIDAAFALLGAIDDLLAAGAGDAAAAGAAADRAVTAADRLVGVLRQDFARELAGRLRFDGGVLAAIVLLGLLLLALFMRLRRLNAGLLAEIDRRIRGERRLRQQEQALRQAADELRVARDEARQADRAKSRFLATMSHEFRTPLNGILGFSWLIERGLQAGRTDAALEDVRRIRGAGEHMLHLVSDVLDLARLEAGMMTVTAAAFDPTALLREIIGAAQPQMDAAGTTFECDLPPLGPASTDATRLRQIIDNLLSNAGRFAEGGRVRLLARRLPAGEPVPPSEIDLEPGGEDRTAPARHAVGLMPSPDRDRLLIRIDDTGPGMSPSQLAAAIEEFVQVDDSPQRRHGGTGLGLSLVARLAPLLGGGVLLESRVGRGTTATLVIPAAPEPGEDPAAATMEPRP